MPTPATLLPEAMAGDSDVIVHPGVCAGGHFGLESSCPIAGEEGGISVDVDRAVDDDF